MHRVLPMQANLVTGVLEALQHFSRVFLIDIELAL